MRGAILLQILRFSLPPALIGLATGRIVWLLSTTAHTPAVVFWSLILLVTLVDTLHQLSRVIRRAEESRREMQQYRQQAEAMAHHQRLETIGALTASISHEFNNLLTPIMGYSMMALEKLPPEDALYDDLLEIYEASRKARAIISRLSALSRKSDDRTFQPVNPDALVRQTLDVALPAQPENVELRLNLNCWDQSVSGNEIQLGQLLLNLILNAYHAMEAAGGVLSISTLYDERSIQLCVSDTGCGIPAEVLPQIFEPFFTTKGAGKGTGLGLAIAAQVAREHQGSIEVASQLSEGTTFTVRLPRAMESQRPESDTD